MSVENMIETEPTTRILKKLEADWTEESALRECLDNPVTAARKRGMSSLRIQIEYEEQSNNLHIIDNAGGLSDAALHSAFILGSSELNDVGGGISAYGSGLKAAAYHFSKMKYNVETNPIDGAPKKSGIDTKIYPENQEPWPEISIDTVPNPSVEEGKTKVTFADIETDIDMSEIKSTVAKKYRRYLSGDGYNGLVLTVVVNGEEIEPHTYKDEYSYTPFWFYPRVYPDLPVCEYEDGEVRATVKVGRVSTDAPSNVHGTEISAQGVVVSNNLTNSVGGWTSDIMSCKFSKNPVRAEINFHTEGSTDKLPCDSSKSRVINNEVLQEFYEKWASVIEPYTYGFDELQDILIEPFIGDTTNGVSGEIRYEPYTDNIYRRHNESPQWFNNGIKSRSEDLLAKIKNSFRKEHPIAYLQSEYDFAGDEYIQENELQSAYGIIETKFSRSTVETQRDSSEQEQSGSATGSTKNASNTQTSTLNLLDDVLIDEYKEKSMETVVSTGYLDEIADIYPAEQRERVLDQGLVEEARDAVETGTDEELVKAFLKFSRFPFDDFYVGFFRDRPEAISENPAQISRLADELRTRGFEGCIQNVEEPVVSNRRMGSLFEQWIASTGFRTETVGTIQDITLDEGESAVVDSSGAELKTYLADQNIIVEKEPDFVVKKNARGTIVHLVGESKIISRNGGNQINQLKDALSFFEPDIENQAYPISVIDGVPWLNRDRQMHTSIMDANHPVVSALHLQELIEEF